MYQTIHEHVAVAGIYQNCHFIPKKFKWGNHEYFIENITLTSDIKDGGVRKRLYSVLASGTLYRLEFNRETEKWFLEEVWFE